MANLLMHIGYSLGLIIALVATLIFVQMYRDVEGKWRRRLLHALVWIVFLGSLYTSYATLLNITIAVQLIQQQMQQNVR